MPKRLGPRKRQRQDGEQVLEERGERGAAGAMILEDRHRGVPALQPARQWGLVALDGALPNMISASAGVTVSATTIEATMARV